MNKFSIIIPMYNAEKYIIKCIDSVLNQNYDNYEIIVINDGSTDRSLELITEKYHNKVKIINKENTGVSDTRNIGIKNATGDWITFLDSDDWLEENTLSEINNLIEKNNVDFIITNLYYNYNDKQVVKYQVQNSLIDKNNKNSLIDTIIDLDYGSIKYGNLYGNCRCIGGKFYKTSLLKNKNILFNNELKTFEDGMLNLEVVFNTNDIYILDKCFYHYYFNDKSATNTIYLNQEVHNELVINEINKLLKKYNYQSKSINYLEFSLFKGFLNTLAYKYKIHINKGAKKIKNNYAFDLDEDKLSKKDRLIYKLIKKRRYRSLYLLYYIKVKNR